MYGMGSAWFKGRGRFWGYLPPLAQWFQWPNFEEKMFLTRA